MPKLTRVEIQEREQFAVDCWKRVWPRGEDASSELVPAAAVNDMVHQKYGEFMRSDKVYRLRDRAIDELRTSGAMVPNPPRKYRRVTPPIQPYRGMPPSEMPVAAQRPQFAAMSTMMPVVIEKFGTTTTTTVSSELLPHMVRGVTPEGAAAISKALDELRRVGLTQLKVEHSGPGYILVGSV